MDRDEVAGKRQTTRYANSEQVNEADAAALPGIAGREDNLGADPASESSLDVGQPVGAVPRSTVTGAHQPGMGANETTDGLSGTEEATRRAAEDETEVDDFEDLPVFDRADAIPKII
jgi:hypothetical protein